MNISNWMLTLFSNSILASIQFNVLYVFHLNLIYIKFINSVITFYVNIFNNKFGFNNYVWYLFYIQQFCVIIDECNPIQINCIYIQKTVSMISNTYISLNMNRNIKRITVDNTVYHSSLSWKYSTGEQSLNLRCFNISWILLKYLHILL